MSWNARELLPSLALVFFLYLLSSNDRDVRCPFTPRRFRSSPTRLLWMRQDLYPLSRVDSISAMTRQWPSWSCCSTRNCGVWRLTTCSENAVSTPYRQPPWCMRPICAWPIKEKFSGRTRSSSWGKIEGAAEAAPEVMNSPRRTRRARTFLYPLRALRDLQGELFLQRRRRPARHSAFEL